MSNSTAVTVLGGLAMLLISSVSMAETNVTQTMFYKAQDRETGGMWDVWLYHHVGTYYLYYLAGTGGWNNISMATSPDGVNWTEKGVAIKGSGGMGTGATWKSPNFEKDGKFFMNFSQNQIIYFAESTDLLKWSRLPDNPYRFAPDERWYTKGGRWDCIWAMVRPEGGYYGYWTASPKRGVGFGFGISRDGVKWECRPSPELDWRDNKAQQEVEVGAVEKIGGKYLALLTAFTRSAGVYDVVTFTADKPEGPFSAAKKNFHPLPGINYCWFPRFFASPDGMLVCHFSKSRSGVHFAPLKEARVDEDNILRLAWWKGNEKLKHEPIAIVKPADSNEVLLTMLGNSFDMKQGIIVEGALRLPQKKGAPRCGLYVECKGNRGAAVLVDDAGLAEIGELQGDGTGFRAGYAVNREMTFGAPAKFRLLAKGSLMEFYLDDVFVGCMGLPDEATGRIGLINQEGKIVDSMKAWKPKS